MWTFSKYWRKEGRSIRRYLDAKDVLRTPDFNNMFDMLYKSLTPILLYLAIQTFILIGALFAKHRIEETLHYQRVREIVYVLETAFLARVFD